MIELGISKKIVPSHNNMPWVIPNRQITGEKMGQFTPREKEILSFMAQGFSNKEIVKQSHKKNIEFHSNNLYSKIVRDPRKDIRSQAVLQYIKENSKFKNPLSNRPLLGLFTRREKEVLYLAGNGFSNPTISQILFLSSKTVENHVNNILEKLNIDFEKQNPRIMMVLAAKAIQKISLPSDRL